MPDETETPDIEDDIDKFRATKFEDAGYFLIATSHQEKNLQISYHDTADNAETAMSDFDGEPQIFMCWIIPAEIVQFLREHPEVAAATDEPGIVLPVSSVGL